VLAHLNIVLQEDDGSSAGPMRADRRSPTMPAMHSRFLLPVAIGAAALAAAAPVAQAAKAPKITAKYTYKVELTGKQTTTWSLNHVGAGPQACDTDQNGSGKEVIRFSSRPAVMYTFDGLSQPYFFQKKGTEVGSLSLPLRGTINRRGSVFTQPLPPGAPCPDGTPTAPPVPDCGTKRIKGLVVEPEYEFKKDKIILEQSDAARDPFENCPGGGSSWPYLLKYPGGSYERIGQQLPYDDLFNQGKNIIIARGTDKSTGGDLTWTTTIRWELSLTRIKKEDLTKK
jgi:hypothetical protein